MILINPVKNLFFLKDLVHIKYFKREIDTSVLDLFDIRITNRDKGIVIDSQMQT